jgi:sarcosine/dimethylglycine N-methyltransferase
VLDIGAGYGGAARRLATRFGCSVTCLNISEVQNDTNRYKNDRLGLSEQIRVIHGVFESIPEGNSSFDVVWSQDAILHSHQRAQVLEEVFRVLKPGGEFVFTDPMQADNVAEGSLQAVYDRLGLPDLATFRFYRETASAIGFEVIDQVDLTTNLRTHYLRVAEELEANYNELRKGASKEYVDKMLIGLRDWVNAADQKSLAWGINRFRKPA